MRQRTAGGAALVVAACLALTGCGDDGRPPAGAAGPARTAPASPTSPTAEPTEPPASPTGVPPRPTEDHVPPPADPAPGDDPGPSERPPRPRPSDQAPTTPSPSAVPTARPTPPSTPEPSPTPSRTPPPAPARVGGPSAPLAFGQTYKWDNGLAVTAGRPVLLETPESQEEDGATETAPPSSTTSGGDAPPDGAAAEEPGASDEDAPAATGLADTGPTLTGPADDGGVVAVDVVLVNGTDRPVNSSVFVAMSSGGVDAEPVHDAASGLTGPPGTMIQPGQNVSFTLGFLVPDAADLAMEVRPAYHYVSALFVHPAAAQG